MQHSKELQTAIDAAKKSAQHAMQYFSTDIHVVFKEDKTPVTKADKESEEIIKSHILSQFPDAQFVGEETGGKPNSKSFWTIDPIDGTRSFSRGVPGWCVLISYCKKDAFVVGVCYFPVTDELLYAERGKGAYYNDKKIHVSGVKKLENAYVAFGNPKYLPDWDAWLRLIKASASVRSWEATYSTFLVAQGKADVLIDGYAQLWDIAPFKVIIEEAGGKITRLDGSPITFENRGALVTNGILHDEVLKILQNKS